MISQFLRCEVERGRGQIEWYDTQQIRTGSKQKILNKNKTKKGTTKFFRRTYPAFLARLSLSISFFFFKDVPKTVFPGLT